MFSWILALLLALVVWSLATAYFWLVKRRRKEVKLGLNALAGMYQQVLGRQADIYGFDYFGDLQARGASMGSMALNMMQTEEGRARGWALTGDAAHDVEMLYQALLGRAADAGGKAVWMQALQSGGMTLAQVADAVMTSAEMQTHYIAPTGWDFLV